MRIMDADLHAELQTIQSKLDQLLALKPVVERHDALLHGNGNAGLVTRLDRLEQRANTNRWLFGLAIPAFLVAVIDAIARLMKW